MIDINVEEENIEMGSGNNNIEIESDVLRIIEVEKDHSKLENLDYEHSGHTGFASKDDIIKNASNIIYKDNFDYGVDNVQDALDEMFVALDAKVDNGGLDNLVSYLTNQNKSDTQKERARKNIAAMRDIVDLGIIQLGNYDDDVDTFFATLTQKGNYVFVDDVDYFTWVVKVIDIGKNADGEKMISQFYICSEEGSYGLNFRDGHNIENSGEWEFAEWDNFLTLNVARNIFAYKDHKHYTILNTTSDIRTYLDSFSQYGDFRIKSTSGNEYYYVTMLNNTFTINGKTVFKRMQRYYSITEPWKVYSRYGEYKSNLEKIVWQNWYINEGVME